ncbi:MAG: preprotein translocase subunit SecG [Bryobacteraceae bacterium]
MTILLTGVHILVCLFLVVVVLLQSGKAADLAGAFGGMGSQTAFGPRGSATVLSKATTIAAALFMVTSLTLAIMATRNASSSSSVLERQKKQPVKTAPAQTPGKPALPTVNVTPQGGKPIQVPIVPQGQPAPQKK